MRIPALSPTRRHFVALAVGFGAGIALAGAACAGDGSDITDSDAFLRQQQGRMIIVDIRTPDEWQLTGVAKDALTIDLLDPEFVQKLVQLRLTNPDKEIGFICASSNRSSQVQQALTQAGFDRVYSVYGGMTGNNEVAGWIADGLPTEGCC